MPCSTKQLEPLIVSLLGLCYSLVCRSGGGQDRSLRRCECGVQSLFLRCYRIAKRRFAGLDLGFKLTPKPFNVGFQVRPIGRGLGLHHGPVSSLLSDLNYPINRVNF